MPIFPAYAATFNREKKKTREAGPREEGRSETRYREGLDGELTRGGEGRAKQAARGVFL